MPAPASYRRPLLAATTAVGANTRVAEVVDTHLARAGAPGLAVVELLVRLACAPDGRRTLSDLASLGLASRTGIARLVDRAAAAGLVTREDVPGDRRATHVVLTPAGRAALAGAGAPWRAGLEETLAAELSPPEAAELTEILRTLLTAHGKRLRAPFARELGAERCAPLRRTLDDVLGDAAPWGELFVLLSSASAVVSDALEAELAGGAGIAASRYEILGCLGAADGGRCSMSRLAAMVVATKSGVSRLVDRMVADGLVAREADPRDRRVTYAVLTPAGADRLERARGVWARALQTHVAAHLEPRAQDRLAELLRPLREARTAA